MPPVRRGHQGGRAGPRARGAGAVQVLPGPAGTGRRRPRRAGGPDPRPRRPERVGQVDPHQGAGRRARRRPGRRGHGRRRAAAARGPRRRAPARSAVRPPGSRPGPRPQRHRQPGARPRLRHRPPRADPLAGRGPTGPRRPRRRGRPRRRVRGGVHALDGRAHRPRHRPRRPRRRARDAGAGARRAHGRAARRRRSIACSASSAACGTEGSGWCSCPTTSTRYSTWRTTCRSCATAASWPRCPARGSTTTGWSSSSWAGRPPSPPPARRGNGTGTACLRADGLAGGALAAASFAVGRGEIVGVAGLEGSGRESFVPLLTGQLTAPSGCRVGGRPGRPVGRARPSASCRHGLRAPGAPGRRRLRRHERAGEPDDRGAPPLRVVRPDPSPGRGCRGRRLDRAPRRGHDRARGGDRLAVGRQPAEGPARPEPPARSAGAGARRTDPGRRRRRPRRRPPDHRRGRRPTGRGSSWRRPTATSWSAWRTACSCCSRAGSCGRCTATTTCPSTSSTTRSWRAPREGPTVTIATTEAEVSVAAAPAARPEAPRPGLLRLLNPTRCQRALPVAGVHGGVLVRQRPVPHRHDDPARVQRGRRDRDPRPGLPGADDRRGLRPVHRGGDGPCARDHQLDRGRDLASGRGGARSRPWRPADWWAPCPVSWWSSSRSTRSWPPSG